MAETTTNTTSDMFRLSDRAVSVIAEEDPCLAIALGLPVAGEPLTDFSPEGCDRRLRTATGLMDEALSVTVTDDRDRIARDVLVERLGNMRAIAEAGDHLRDINILFSPPQVIRMSLELLPPDADQQRLVQVLDAVPGALAGWIEALALGAETGEPAARRQAVAVAAQLKTYADSWFAGYARSRGGGDVLVASAERAAGAATDTCVWLSDVYSGVAREADAVGEDRYLRASRNYNGIDLDLDDTFLWGWSEVERLTDELRTEAGRIAPRAELRELRAVLDSDPDYQIHGVPALTEHLEHLTDDATEAVDGKLFRIDPRVRRCEVFIAGEGAAAAPYYVPPSEDLSRPGSTWFPTRGRDVFPRWWLQSVWFHEGVPGHHLQLGAIAAQDDMSRFQRTLASTSGHAEGWALYAERLADELGWFDEPGTRIGFLSGQLMRAVRVVVDIGMHTGRTVPKGFPGQGSRIDAKLSARLLQELALVEPDFAASEVDRYLGMPAQAISYKVGERFWREARSQAQERVGSGFDLMDWHMAAMQLGPMGLAQFRDEMSSYGR
jgi:uncharacterized protein (DUF885 family)